MKRSIIAFSSAAALTLALSGSALAQTHFSFGPYGYAAPHAYGYDYSYAAPRGYVAPRGEVLVAPESGASVVYDPPYNSPAKTVPNHDLMAYPSGDISYGSYRNW
jgi:hypothetical protein